MNFGEFDAEVCRLRETYGERFYPPSRLEVFWQTLRGYRIGDLTAAVTNLIATQQQPPMLDRLVEAIDAAARTRSDHARPNEVGKIRCGYCRGSGLINARRKVGGKSEAPYVFRCSKCAAGSPQNVWEGITLWSDVFAKDWAILGLQTPL